MLNRIISMIFILFITTNLYAFNIVGTWKLISIERKVDNQWKPDCYSPTGLLIYTSNGYMSASLNCMLNNNQPSFLEKNLTFYAGTYTLKNNDIIHHVNNANSSTYFGKNLTRKVQIISDNKMNLLVQTNNGHLIRLKWLRTNN